MLNQSAWLHRWIYHLASGLMFAAVALRSVLVFRDSPSFAQILAVLTAWFFLWVGDLLFAPRRHWLPVVMIGAEILLTLNLLLLAHSDFFIFLFAIPCMQTMQRFTSRETAFAVGLTTLLTFLSLFQQFGMLYAFAITVVFFGGSLFLLTYIGASQRASLLEEQQKALVVELEQINRQLESYARQLQQLAAERERQRLGRELHDSVTQTIFSMTLTTQSALMLLEQDHNQVAAQLDRLDQLSWNALSEMQILISRLAPKHTGGFLPALQQHVEERRRLENLSVDLHVKGNQRLTPVEEQNLLRIIQEALNNIVKHAGVTQANIHLELDRQPCLEIEDQGVGFELGQATGQGRVGLMSMQERAAEIGWSLWVDSAPGSGTRIRVWKG